MFEIEKMDNEFDYSLVDKDTANFLRSCEYEMNGIAEDTRLKFGRVLKDVQERLANHYEGVFYKWFESGGLNKHDVYYAINLYELSTNLDNTQKDNFLNAPKTLQKEVMKKSAPEELRQQVYSGDITTNKEYQEIRRKLKEAESRELQAIKSEEIALKKLEEEQSKEPKMIEKEVVKEIDNTDYSSLHKLQEQLERRERSYSLLEKEKEALENKMNLLEEQNDEFEELKNQISTLSRKKDHIGSQLEAATSLSGLVVKIDDLIKTELAPIEYSRAIQEMQDDPIVMENLNDIVNTVQSWCDDMREYLPNDRKNIKNVEVIDYEG